MSNSQYTLEEFPTILDRLAQIQWGIHLAVSYMPGSGIVECLQDYATKRNYGFHYIDTCLELSFGTTYGTKKTVVVVDHLWENPGKLPYFDIPHPHAKYIFLHPYHTPVPAVLLTVAPCTIADSSPRVPSTTIEL